MVSVNEVIQEALGEVNWALIWSLGCSQHPNNPNAADGRVPLVLSSK